MHRVGPLGRVFSRCSIRLYAPDRYATWSGFRARQYEKEGEALLDSHDNCRMAATCNRSAALTYPAPRYFPCPPFVVSLETEGGRCNLGSPPVDSSTGRVFTLVERQQRCADFSRGSGPFPEPFVAQVITSVLGDCPATRRRCRAVDLGGNLGIHTSYMASLGAVVDVFEPQADLAASIRRTAWANCWEDRVRAHHAGVTADEAADGSVLHFKGGWRLDDTSMDRRRAENVSLVAVQRLLRGQEVDLLKIDIDNSALEEQLLVALERLLAAGETRVRALVMEVSTTRLRAGKSRALARALSRLQRAHGYHAYRLAHHLHSMDDLEPWYTPCIGIHLGDANPGLCPACARRCKNSKTGVRILVCVCDRRANDQVHAAHPAAERARVGGGAHGAARRGDWHGLARAQRAACRLARAKDARTHRHGLAAAHARPVGRGRRGAVEFRLDGSDDAQCVAGGAVRHAEAGPR